MSGLAGSKVLVNNAGVYEEHPITTVDYEAWQAAWRRTIDTNLIGAANVTFCAVRHMLGRGGRIVNVSSRGAWRLGRRDCPYRDRPGLPNRSQRTTGRVGALLRSRAGRIPRRSGGAGARARRNARRPVILLDTNVLIYASGGDHPLKAPCRAIIQISRSGLARSISLAERTGSAATTRPLLRPRSNTTSRW